MMKRIIINIISLLYISLLSAVTLQSVYESAEPLNGYDKYLILDKDIIYTGEIGVYEGSVFIKGNGAIVNLNEGLGLWVYADENNPASLDIEYLTIINGGYNGISFNGPSTGNITNCNFISNDFGIQVMDEAEINVSNCNFIDHGSYGVAIRGTSAVMNIDYCNFWGNNLGCSGYNENC